MTRYYMAKATFDAIAADDLSYLALSLPGVTLGIPAQCDKNGDAIDPAVTTAIYYCWDDPRIDESFFPLPFRPFTDPNTKARAVLPAAPTKGGERAIALCVTDIITKTGKPKPVPVVGVGLADAEVSP